MTHPWAQHVAMNTTRASYAAAVYNREASQNGPTGKHYGHNILQVLPRNKTWDEQYTAFVWILTDWTCISAGLPRIGFRNNSYPEKSPWTLKKCLDLHLLEDPLENDEERTKRAVELLGQQRENGINTAKRATQTTIKTTARTYAKSPIELTADAITQTTAEASTDTIRCSVPSPRKRRCLSGGRLSSWPAQRVPVEIFELITSYLPRDDVKTLRMVCKEFERKVISFFRTVTLQFSPDIYGSESLDASIGPGQQDMKMFHERGWGIRHFAIAFEFCEDLLKVPLPNLAKPELEETTHYFGDMAWPSRKDVRYDQIQDLETTADKVQKMKNAFSCLQDVVDLGLCLDSGLSWLNGPDESDRHRLYKRSPQIFPPQYARSQDLHACHAIKHVLKGTSIVDPEPSSAETFWLYARLLISHTCAATDRLETIAQYIYDNPIGRLAGLDAGSVQDHVDLFIATSNILKRYPQAGEDVSSTFMKRVTKSLTEGNLTDPSRSRKGQRKSNPFDTSKLWNQAVLLYHEMKVNPRDVWKDDIRHYISPRISSSQPIEEGSPSFFYDGVDVMDTYSYAVTSLVLLNRLSKSPLKPSQLSNLQIRLLKENEWAQKAFLNTYILAVVDNRATMSNVQSLTIANIGTSYLAILDRQDFWDGLPNAQKITLLVSPDWREITSAPAVARDDHKCRTVDPSKTVDKLRLFVNKRIKENHRVKELTLGFVGGGEHASGLYARNRNILPAPIICSLTRQVSCWPYIEKLTFVNCWAVPTVLVNFVNQMRKQSLKELKLDSFSLLAFRGQTMQQHFHIAPASFIQPTVPYLNRRARFGVRIPNVVDAFNFQSLEPPLSTIVTRPPDSLEQAPLPDTWGEVLNSITPGKNPAEAYCNPSSSLSSSASSSSPSSSSSSSSSSDDEEHYPPPKRDKGSLVRLELASCGYIKLPYQLLCPEFEISAGPYSGPLLDRIRAIKPFMMETDDIYLGQIIPRFIESDRTLLTEFYAMRTGWGHDKRRLLNLEDGQLEGGSGRFSGVIGA